MSNLCVSSVDILQQRGDCSCRNAFVTFHTVSLLTYMTLSTTIQSTLLRHNQVINIALRNAIHKAEEQQLEMHALHAFYGQMHYHLGWVDSNLRPIQSNPGKLLRPTLLLLAYEASGAWGLATSENNEYLRRALPAAAAIELTHNFTLIHDDIEDGDVERRHRPTLWKQWGISQALNTGDGVFALSRLTLWDVLDEGVEGTTAATLGAALDRACLVLAEGQYLDISFEQRLNISVAMYIDMIQRKTGALMACAAAMGGLLGTRDSETIESLRHFGWAMGIAFQVRDDILGIWATTAELGKTPAGDLYRRKKSLPILHALEHASEHDSAFLREVYTQHESLTSEQVKHILTIFARTNTRAYCHDFLAQQCTSAYEALANVPHYKSSISERARNDLETLVHFVAESARS
ncbi:MAG: polyprenyl synthetase family protein [Ktedonobacteraceae bacterium]